MAGIFLYYAQIAILCCPLYSGGVPGSLSNLHVGVLLAGLHPAAEQPEGRGALGWCIGDGVLDGIYDIISP